MSRVHGCDEVGEIQVGTWTVKVYEDGSVAFNRTWYQAGHDHVHPEAAAALGVTVEELDRRVLEAIYSYAEKIRAGA